MKTLRILGALGLAAAIAAGGCSRNEVGSSISRLVNVDPQDSIPPPPPPPPPPPVIQPALFQGSDSTAAGSTGVTRWRLGNDSDAPFTMQWTLTNEYGWAGFPIQGSAELDPQSTMLIEVPVSVPATATTGMYELRITVTRPGDLTYVTDGSVRVFGNDPPPPPPPPFPAVEYVGSDDMRAGSTGFTRWRVGNESSQPFTVSWSLRGGSGWPQFPMQGTVDLAGLERRVLEIPVAVPDTAVVGPRWFEMAVTRPDGNPPMGAGGEFSVVP